MSKQTSSKLSKAVPSLETGCVVLHVVRVVADAKEVGGERNGKSIPLFVYASWKRGICGELGLSNDKLSILSKLERDEP